MSAGDLDCSERCLISSQRWIRKRRSARSSSSDAPSAAVRTMNPPEASPRSLSEDPLQALALFVGGDLAADADVGDGGHEDQEAAGQRDVGGDARALLGDGLLGDLDQDLLAGLEQVADDGQVGGLRGAARGPPRRLPPRSPCGARSPRRPRPPRSRRSRAGRRAPPLRAAFASALPLPRLRSSILFVAVLVVEVQLDVVVEVRFLQHLAQFAGANLRLELFLFLVVVQIVFVVAAVVMTRSIRLPRPRSSPLPRRPEPGAKRTLP